MHKNSRPILRASALLLPLMLAATPAAWAQGGASSGATGQAAAQGGVYQMPLVAASIPADANAHMNQLNADTALPVIGGGAKGPAVLRAQVLLDRAWFSSGEIDGVYGRNVRFAVTAFQMSRGLPQTGIVDAATWQALGQQAQKPVFTTYLLTGEDLAGPYLKLPEDPKLQAELERLPYQSPLEALSERFHIKPQLLAALNRDRPVRAGQLIVVPDVSTAAPLPAEAKAVRVDKSDKMLYLLGDGNRLLAAFPVSIGGITDELPAGEVLSIVNEVKNPNFTYDPSLLKNAKTDTVVRLPPGPNNPVGVAWLGLSREHWGIHGTAEPSQMARVETNGCIRLTNWDVLRLATVTAKGMPVQVQS